MNVLEPIAIVGMACRFSGGVDSLPKFWELLRSGGDTVGDLPAGRWDWYAEQSPEHHAAVRGATTRGAYLEDVRGFDADFFEITPREAELMDPQQRIVLELAWEALEHAGVPPHAISGTDAGVFMGVGADDYGRRLLEDLPHIEAWTGIGGAYCAVANRISYLLNLRGPSMAVDTACSSSLVAIHLAAQALRAGECPLAIVGGVLVMAAPGLSLVLDAAGATAPDGRSKSFDAAADGYGRGEGAGVVVLKRLRDAQRDGDRVLAVVRGSAVHQDGRTNGIMAPNGQAQAHLMRRAYEAARIDPGSVQYVEAHGTGTRAGDPLEAAAMTEVFGAGRPAGSPCLIGSVKPNIGHLEAGAGIAGMIKAVLALQHAEIPPSIITDPSPAISWENSGLRVADRLTPWPAGTGPRRAGVSAYGYGGTLAHVILEQAQEPVAPRGRVTAGKEQTAAGLALYPISGAGEAAVRQYADRLAGHLDAGGFTPVDVAHTLSRRRTHLPHRAVVVADDSEDLALRLREVAASGPGAIIGGVLPSAAQGLVWVFSGHGSQWVGMGTELLDTDPAFTAVIDELEPWYAQELGLSLRAAITADTEHPVDVTQPMIFAMQTALAAYWQSHGVRPDAVIGHSVGEIAAAVTADVLSLEEGARLVCRRSLLLRRVIGRGAMAMVNLTAEDLDRRLQGRTDLAVAVVASTTSTVVSGDVGAVRDAVGQWRAEGLEVRPIASDVAFHGPQMDPLLDELEAAVATLEPRSPAVVLYTTALEDPRSAEPRTGRYWAANLRGRVQFAQAVAAAVKDGYRLFAEISPHPVVEHSINEMLAELGVEDACVTHSTRRRQPEQRTLLTNLGVLYCHGARVDWAAHHPYGQLMDLPSTVWQHRSYWAQEHARASGATWPHDPAGHTLLGRRIGVHANTPAHVWTTRLDRDTRPYPGSHPVRGVEIVPAAVLLTTFLAAAGQSGGPADLSSVSLRIPVSLTMPRDLQVVVQDRTVRLATRIAQEDGDDRGWLTHTTAVIEARTGFETGPVVVTGDDDLEPLPPAFVEERLAELGVAAMGFPWRVTDIRRDARSILATIDACDPALRDTWACVLDAALSIASVSFAGPPILRMPAHIDHVSLADSAPARARIQARVTGEATVDVVITDVHGIVAGRLTGLRYGAIDREEDAVADPRRLVHEISWSTLEPTVTATAPPELVLVAPGSAMLTRLTTTLADAAIPFRVVATAEDLDTTDLTAGHAVVVVPGPGQDGDVAGTATRSAWILTRCAQRLADARHAVPARLWCVTEGVKESTDEAALAFATLWGLGRIIGGEHPEFWGGIIDVDASPLDALALTTIITSAGREDVVAVRDGHSRVPRLRRLEGRPVRPAFVCRPGGTYLITGGLGALGLEVASWLASRGARRLVLAGRHGLPPRDRWETITDARTAERVAAVRALERLGVTVVVVAVDIADRQEVAARLSPQSLGLPQICGVVHAAGVVDNRMLGSLDEPTLRRVLRPKVSGALVLHEMFPPGSVEFFVLFSSSGQLLGLPGQAAYAAGNAFLDSLAQHRRGHGDDRVVSFGWTSWHGLGMSTSSAAIDAELEARGTADITADEAFGAWELADRHDLGYAAVLRTLAPQAGGRMLPLLSGLSTGVPVAADEATVADPWAGLSGQPLHDFFVQAVRIHVAAETHLPVVDLDARRPLMEMGLDSVMTVRVRRGLERQFRIPLPATLFWDRPTIEAVASLLVEVVAGDVWPC
ncbi:phthiocerol type I polyketide synthase PpsA [Winogradskya consettensis]|uniref:Phthiocerol synthesis polyketide synthase type I PpsA n=1 Tax=Winogradskya consettensis TaxID=113560 RepID=A0A919VWH2_9ACTN|nr:type I polyketide synthase [Actinoplanes consettensis]GIM82501.1 phthiocerol synthesis polyketide synthase type I PpsA [Actinoplanes consettensis]